MFKNKTEKSYKRISYRIVYGVGIVLMALVGLTLPNTVEAGSRESTASITFEEPTSPEEIKKVEEMSNKIEKSRVKELHRLEVVAPGNQTVTTTYVYQDYTRTIIVDR